MGELPDELAHYEFPDENGLKEVRMGIIDDDANNAAFVEAVVSLEGGTVVERAATVAGGIELINRGDVNSLLLDRQFPDGVYEPQPGEAPSPMYTYIQSLRQDAKERLEKSRQQQIDAGTLLVGPNAPAITVEGGDIIIQHIIRNNLLGKFAIVAASGHEDYDISGLKTSDPVQAAASERLKKPYHVDQLSTAIGKTALAQRLSSGVDNA